MAAPGKQPKAMSSRLAGMKFMQRASAPNSPSTPGPAEPPAKRQRMSNGSSIRSPATPVDKQEQKRVDAIEQEGAQRGETKWYLSFKAPKPAATESPLRIVSAGFSALDAPAQEERSTADDEEDVPRPQVAGRKNFGNFGKKKEQKHQEEEETSEEDDEDEDDEDDFEDDPTGVKALIARGQKDATDRVKAERKAKKQEENAESQRLAEQRRKKGVNLNHVTSISGRGGSGAGLKNMECYKCGEKGHRKVDCPQGGQRR